MNRLRSLPRLFKVLMAQDYPKLLKHVKSFDTTIYNKAELEIFHEKFVHLAIFLENGQDGDRTGCHHWIVDLALNRLIHHPAATIR